MNDIKLKDLFFILGYGSKVCVIDADTDEEIFSTDDFFCPYSLKDFSYGTSKVVCWGNGINHPALKDRIYIFVRKEI